MREILKVIHFCSKLMVGVVLQKRKCFFFQIKGMKNLDSLILAHNQLTSVPTNVFRHLTLLSSLELEGNNIAYVDKDAFAGLEGT